MSVETVLLKRRRALYTRDSSTVICNNHDHANQASQHTIHTIP